MHYVKSWANNADQVMHYVKSCASAMQVKSHASVNRTN